MVGIVVAMVTLIFHDDPARWTTAEGQRHSTSDLVTGTESLISLSILAAVVAIAWIVLGPGAGSARSALSEDRLGDALHPGVDREQ